MESITVGLGDRSYIISCGRNVLGDIGMALKDAGLGKICAVITNPTIAAIYGDVVRASLVRGGFVVHMVEIPDGEEYKNITTLNRIYDALLSRELDRGAFIVALGGGVVGDITGFAAATYLRGVPFVQVPTTLLAQVDSSVGGKTGINHERGKNLIGAFYQPRRVVIDVDVLQTLPVREYLCGLAEVIKYGVVLDASLFDYLENNVHRLLERDPESLRHIILRSCAIKAMVVEKDEREAGMRAVLNYGHTFGHAVETLTGYTTYKHGEAVAIGMAQAACCSEHLGFSDAATTGRIRALLSAFGLPTALPSFAVAEYVSALLHDKKVRDGGVHFVCNRGIGAFHIERIADVHLLLKLCGIGA